MAKLSGQVFGKKRASKHLKKNQRYAAKHAKR